MQLIFPNSNGVWPEEWNGAHPVAVCRQNRWNDYGYETLFRVTIYTANGVGREIGDVKIGRYGYLTTDPKMRTELRGVSPGLGDKYFSVGQEDSYYDRLRELGPDIWQSYAAAIRDIPLLDLNRDLLQREEVFRVSLTRFPSALHAADFAQDAIGEPRQRFSAFQFKTQLLGASAPHIIPFNFSDDDGFPHRMNVLIGENGVGKTHLMARLAVLLSGFEEKEDEQSRPEGETLEALGEISPRPSIYGVIAVSFSAFDNFAIPTAAETRKVRYVYCGIRKEHDETAGSEEIGRRISRSFKKMDAAQRAAVKASAQLLLGTDDETITLTPTFYNALSAGQRIALNIVCELVLHLKSRHLILIDEPETHLHPQLLIRLMQVIALLLSKFESWAVIATHSPVVVQQISARRVHIVRRVDRTTPAVAPPPIETFGESLSEIFRVVFETAENDRDYRQVVDEIVERYHGDPKRVPADIVERLGSNAHAYFTFLTVNAQPGAEPNEE
ncbi:ATP-dependent nuclease [Asticcacaulis sp. W401b]|uniref:ATP-dependent nuclease n=1 Tax=Asticcacaulis sp. W401b TaxID=3388666 RepID=UPI00397063B3